MFSIRKARAPTPHDFVAKSKPKKSKAGKDALKKLNDYLNSASSEPMYFLHNFWKAQSNAITYKELREAIMNGYLDISIHALRGEGDSKNGEKHLRFCFIIKRSAQIWKSLSKNIRKKSRDLHRTA